MDGLPRRRRMRAFIGSYGRAFDVTVMSRPGADTTSLHTVAPSSPALFESGRPVLLAPPDGCEADRNQHHDPLERQHRAGARQRLCDAAAAPRRPGHGIDRRWRTGCAGAISRSTFAGSCSTTVLPPSPSALKLGDRGTGEAVLDAAKAEGCDLLVKGAFTRNRLRQMIFGGATSHIMQHADLPLLMAH